jgi:Zn-dependent protease with chaperone function
MDSGTPELSTEWFDGRSPRPQRAWLRCADGELILRLQGAPESETRSYALRRVRWPERRAYGLRQTGLPDGSMVQHADAGEWDAWALANVGREGRVVGWMQSWRGALGAMAATVVLLAAAWQWGLPWLSTTLAGWVPASVQRNIGETSLKQLQTLFLKPSAIAATEQAQLRKNFEALVQRAYPVGDAPAWQLLFRKSEALGANAFALPGGSIVITDDLVTLLKDVPDATLGVLAHEFGHVHNRHGIDLMVRASLVSALVGLVIGDASGFLATVPATLATQAYSRDAERESDAQAAAMLHASGLSPAIMVTFFERMAQAGARSRRIDPPTIDGKGANTDKTPMPKEGVGRLPIAISSHPDSDERLRFFKNWAPSE